MTSEKKMIKELEKMTNISKEDVEVETEVIEEITTMRGEKAYWANAFRIIIYFDWEQSTKEEFLDEAVEKYLQHQTEIQDVHKEYGDGEYELLDKEAIRDMIIDSYIVSWFNYYYPLQFYVAYFNELFEEYKLFDYDILCNGMEHFCEYQEKVLDKAEEELYMSEDDHIMCFIIGECREMYERGIEFSDEYNENHINKFYVTKDNKVGVPIKYMKMNKTHIASKD